MTGFFSQASSARAFFALLILMSSSFASFTFVQSFNGSSSLDVGNQFSFSQPTGILYANNILYVTDANKAFLQTYNGTTYGRISASIGSRESSESPFYTPMRMSYDNGLIYIADGSSGTIKTYAGTGSQILNWNSGGSMGNPTGLAPDKNFFYITDAGKGQVIAYSKATKSFSFLAIGAGASDGLLSSPKDIEAYNNRYYVSDSDKGLVFVYDSNFAYLFAIGRGLGGVTLHSPRGMALQNDRLFVADTTANRIVEFALDGYPLSILDSSMPGANLSYPEDVTLDGNRLFVADTMNKLVKVFLVNETMANSSVQHLLASANQSYQSLQSVKQAAFKLNIAVEPDTFGDDLSQAQLDYSHYQYASASALSNKIISGAPVVQANLSQRVGVSIKQLVKQASDKVAPCRPQAKGGAVAMIASFDATVADINAKLAAKSYPQAADLALSLGKSADAIVDAVAGEAAKEELAKNEKLSSQANLQLELVEVKLVVVEDKSTAYRQNVNTSAYRALIENVRKAIEQGDFVSANRTISSLLTDLSAQEGYLLQSGRNIDDALANISIIEAKLNSSAAKPVLFPANLAETRSQISSAREQAYANPALGVALAAQAADSASSKIKDSESLSIAVAAMAVIFGLMLLIGIASFLHMKNRKPGFGSGAGAKKNEKGGKKNGKQKR